MKIGDNVRVARVLEAPPATLTSPTCVEVKMADHDHTDATLARKVPLARFWEKINKSDGGCWLWTAAHNGLGYGRFWTGTRVMYAHRLSYEIQHGPIPTGMVLDHLCRNPSCVNPAHLEPVSQRENIRRGAHSQINGRWHKEKTHCPRGHAYSGENLYENPKTGERACRTCNRENMRRYRAARKLRAAA